MSEEIDIIKPTDTLLAELRGMIVEAQGHVAQVANAALTMLFWIIGQRIHRDILREKRAVNGKQIVAALGRHSTTEFGAEDRMTPDLARTLTTKTSRLHQDFASTTGSEEERIRVILLAYPGWAFAKGDYIISTRRYILTDVLEKYRPISKFVAELEVIEAEARVTDKACGRY